MYILDEEIIDRDLIKIHSQRKNGLFVILLGNGNECGTGMPDKVFGDISRVIEF